MQGGLYTYSILIKTYGQSCQVNMVWKLWDDITRKQGLVPSGQLYGQMVDMLVTNNLHDQALALFGDIKRDHALHLSSQGFAVAYTVVIKGFAHAKGAR